MQNFLFNFKRRIKYKKRIRSSEYDLIKEVCSSISGLDRPCFSDCGDGYKQATFFGVEPSVFSTLGERLEKIGFALYSENQMKDNPFVCFVRNDQMVYAYYVCYSCQMRIIAAKGAKLPSLDVVGGEKVCEPEFSFIGLEAGGGVCGLSCVLRLCDGTFIIVDGGHDIDFDADELVRVLDQLSVSGSDKIVIRAWFITHGHGDHYGALLNFSRRYKSSGKYIVERFMINFCDAEEQHQYSRSGTFNLTLNCIDEYWKDSDIYKPLTGQVYKFAGCDCEIFYCMSDFIPAVIGEECPDAEKAKVDGNIQSVAFRFNVCGQGIFITSDLAKVNIDEMCKRYGEYMKSDIMTVPHHANDKDSYRARNGTIEFYDLVDPETVLWPDRKVNYKKRLEWNGVPGANFERNYYLVNCLHVKECIVSGDTTRFLPLPYHPANACDSDK